MARNPCEHVPALAVGLVDVEYLRVGEIRPYLDACAEHYLLLAEFLVGTGARISKAVATRGADLDAARGLVRIYRPRERSSDGWRKRSRWPCP